MLRTLSLWLHSAVTGSYVSGTYSIVFVNCPNEQIARDIARYFWNGEIEEATEILLLIKTKTSRVHVLSSYIRSPKDTEVHGGAARGWPVALRMVRPGLLPCPLLLCSPGLRWKRPGHAEPLWCEKKDLS
ncbi:protein CutA homolog isoform X3 [Ailuropoda melanoleuca]|uniref:protein CutA homolog isoform X3 n=1 Tax=Ailuropoda melanoleuca TaxID=9646 RepID=UPI001494DB93|nr:protein CutA homolog isoform X3 [Ailuropoda melanoleuca]